MSATCCETCGARECREGCREVAIEREHKAKAKAMSVALVRHVNTLLLAMTLAKIERERVDKIQRKVLEEGIYTGRERPDMKQFRVTDPKRSYLMDDHSLKLYFARLNAIHLAEGFAKAAEGHCPALTAETLQTEAEWALMEAAEEFFPQVTNNRLLCGVKGKDGLTLRREYLDLLIGLVVNAPGYVPPLHGKAGVA